MYRLSIKNSQSEFANTGMLFQSTYYVDNFYKSTGIETCCFSTAISGTSDALTNGAIKDQTTMAYACKNNSSIKGTPLKASGIIYKQSARDRYGRTDNFDSETRLYPYSSREDKAIGFLKKGVVEISYISNMQSINNASTHHIYRTYDKLLNGTVTVNPLEDIVQFSDISAVAGLKYGDKVKIDSNIYWIISVNESLGQIIIDSVIEAGVVAVEITILSQIEDPIFLNNEPTIISSAKGVFGNTSNFPWTPIPTKDNDELLQVVGYVESPIAVRIDINNCCEGGSTGVGVNTLVDLTDTNIVSPEDAEVLTYDNGTGKWINSSIGDGTLVGLTDTNITNPTDTEILRYDSGTGEWINSPDDLPVPSLTEEVEQATHGFIQNDVLAHDGTSYILADVTDEEVIVIGIVSEVIDVNNFVISRIGYMQNSGLTALLATVDADNILYLGLNGGLVPKSHISIDVLNKIPVLHKIENDKAEILTSTQYFGFKNKTNVSTLYFGYPGNGDIVEGSWKIELDGLLLKYYRYEVGVWVLKNTIGASIITDSFVLEDSSGQVAFERPLGGRQTLLKPSIDGFGAVLGNPDGRVGFVSHGEHTLAYPKTENPVWVTDNIGVGTYTPMATYYEESNTITNDEIMYKIRIYVSTTVYKFRFALLNALDDSVLLQNLTQSEYDLESNITPLIVGENTIELKYPIAFTKGLNIRVILQTPTNTSIEIGTDGKSANSIYRKFADLGTINYSLKWRYGTDFVEGDVIHLEAFDTGYELSKIGRYRTLVDHTAGIDFDTDFLAGKWEKIREGGYSDSEIKIRYENNVNTNEFSDAEKAKLASLTGGQYLGVYADYAALVAAHPTANDGDTATVTSPDNHLWYWNEDSWEDSGMGNGGDMLKAVYDPTNKATNAFNMDNMDEGTNSKILTLAERNKLVGIEPLAEVNNMSDIYATDLTDMGDTTLHYHSEDRDRSNHTGTQIASTISDFDTKVSNNTDVANNIAHSGTVTGNPHNVLATQITDFDTEVSNNVDVIVNTAKVSFPEAPENGKQYARKNSTWDEILTDDKLNGYLNGMSIERQELNLVVEGTSVFLDIQAIGGGDITYFMNNQKYILNCTTGDGVGGKARIEIPQGTENSPLRSIVYAFYDTVLSNISLAATYASIPSEEYIPVAIITIQTYSEVSDNGALLLQRTTEAITHNGKSAISWEREKIRSLGARYWSGIDQDLIITANQTSEDSINFTTTSGSVFQLHRQSFPEYDISTDGLWVSNASGSLVLNRYQKITNLNEIKEDAEGNVISDGDCINLVIWGSVNHSEDSSKMFVNLPKSLYANEDEARADINNNSITTIPNEFSTTGFLIAKVILKYNSDNNGTWTNLLSETTEIWNTGYQTIETPNYPNNYDSGFNDYIGTITHLGASRMRVKFDDFKTETNYDFIRLRNGVSDTNIYNYSGIYQSFVSGEIDGDTIRIKFESDGSITKKGVSITSYEYLTNGNSGNKVIDLRGIQPGVNVSSNSSGIVDAPNDGNSYVRKNEEWALMIKSGFTLHFDANDAIYNINHRATAGSRNGHPIISFSGVDDDGVTFGDTIPNSYNAEAITVDIDWVAETATSGAVNWLVSFERNTPGGNDIDSDSYALARTGTSTTNATNGKVTRTSITFTQAQADGVTANDHFRIKLLRDPNDAGDTMTGNAQLLKISVRV